MALAALGTAGGCMIEDQTKPTFVGPSELALSLSVTATPDTLPRDGASQAVVAVLARDAYSKPVPNVTLRAQLECLDGINQGQVVDWGRLSTTVFVTGSDGRATATYTAPSPSVASICAVNSPVWLVLTPVGTDYANAVSRYIMLRLIQATGGPIASFVYSPTTPTSGTRITFDASSSTAPTGRILVAWDWDFSGGSLKSGVVQTKQYDLPGYYTVALTVTDDSGAKSTTWQTVVVQ